MLKLIFAKFLVVLSVSTAAQAAVEAPRVRNPLIRVCVANAGSFWIYNLGRPVEVPTCRFDKALIGALDFFLATAGDKTDATSAFFAAQSPNMDPDLCKSYEGTGILAEDSEGSLREFCMFKDNSFIEVQTLAKGYQHPDNAKLYNLLRKFLR